MATLLLLLIYIAFISLGLPDALLGSAWPVMQPDLSVPYEFAGIVQVLISAGTIVSSMFSGLLIKRFGTGKLTAISVALTAGALMAFAATPSFWVILLASIPLGLGGGAVDSALNAYVANHYESRHMSWLHSFWGVGALGGPLVLSMLLRHGFPWRRGYASIGTFQIVLVLILIAAIPLWDKVKTRKLNGEKEDPHHHIPFFAALKIKGVPMALIVFLFYCGIETTMGLWGGSFLFKVKGLTPAAAATWVSLYYGSITLGRLLTGFLTYKLSNNTMIRSGALIILSGVVLMLIPLSLPFTLAGFIIIGFGCAPIFPSMLHETPARFGRSSSQSIMGFQMAVAYIGTTILPPLFGFVAGAAAMHLLPVFLLTYIVFLLLSFEQLRLATKG